MSRTKRALLCLLLAALATACASAEDLIAQEDIMQETANYQTQTVRREDFIIEGKTSVDEQYPLVIDAVYEGIPARFVEYLVKNGDEVKKGDLLATLYYEVDEVQIGRLRLAIQRGKEALKDQEEAYQETIAQLRLGLAEMGNVYDREVRKLEIQRQELAYEQARYTQTYALTQQQEALDELLAQYEQAGLYAPMDGVVSKTIYKREHDMVYDGEALVILYDPSVMLMVGEDSSNRFRYNMTMAVEIGNTKNRTSRVARVICADNVLPPAMRNGKIYVQMESYTPGERMVNPSARCESVVVRDALVVNRRAVESINGVYYVNRLAEETPQMRYINYAKTNNTDVWILQGVSEGDVLIED